MTFVVASLLSAYEALSDSEKAAVSPYLESTPLPTPTPDIRIIVLPDVPIA